jgi:hypothetical protein
MDDVALTMSQVLGSAIRLRALLWIALEHEDKELTVEKVGELLDNAIQNGQELRDVTRPLMDAVRNALGGEKETGTSGEEGESAGKSDGTGATS